MTGFQIGLALAGTFWPLGGMIWLSYWAFDSMEQREQGEAALRRRALRNAWLTPIWPVLALPILARNVRDEIAPWTAKTWTDAWGDEGPHGIEPATVDRIDPTPGQWEQPPPPSPVCRHRRVRMALCLDCGQSVT